MDCGFEKKNCLDTQSVGPPVEARIKLFKNDARWAEIYRIDLYSIPAYWSGENGKTGVRAMNGSTLSL